MPAVASLMEAGSEVASFRRLVEDLQNSD